ncbi:unnamed protein product [Trifolium pratense]|uniref:Uncharacterized protein n=1 Tax=Trifolium pratense TaxID=57577 RepID=A0ACB0LY56_TRIPR|nr:unnamed protein product [Trifolium pratense]
MSITCAFGYLLIIYFADSKNFCRALGAYNKLQRARKQKKVEWFFPTIFLDSKPFQKDEVKNVQERCGNMILEHIEVSADNDMN